MAEFLESQGYPASLAKIDPSVVRGLDYYTGPVYEAELTFDILDDKGEKRQFGSVAAGGRYDDLVMRFTGQRTPATGVSIGVDRLLAALRARGGQVAEATNGPVVVLAPERDRMSEYQSIATDLRNLGIRGSRILPSARVSRRKSSLTRNGRLNPRRAKCRAARRLIPSVPCWSVGTPHDVPRFRPRYPYRVDRTGGRFDGPSGR